MNYKHLQFILILCIVVPVCAQIYNGDFEGEVELIEQNDPGVYDFNAPIGWERENYTAVVERFVPNGRSTYWLIDPNTELYPFDGNFYLLLSTGDYRPEPGEDMKTKVSQIITVSAGQTIKGVYFFGTCDYLHWDDTAEIVMLSENDTNDVNLVQVSVADVGDYSSAIGWQKFEYIFAADQAGTYELNISIWDVDDGVLNSYFAVDSLILCDSAIGAADIDMDCTVNFKDFTLLANDWLQDCSDPNYLEDPNNNCWYGTDIDDNGPVDANDLYMMSQFWLDGDIQ